VAELRIDFRQHVGNSPRPIAALLWGGIKQPIISGDEDHVMPSITHTSSNGWSLL